MSDNEVAINLTLAIDKAKAKLDEIQGSIGTFSSNANSFFGGTTAAWASFKGSIYAEVVTKGFEEITKAARALFQEFVVNGISAAMEEEESIASLNIALSQTGIYSRATAESFAELSAELQKTTRYDGDAILKATAHMQTLAQLDAHGLKRATKATVDFAAAMHMDLDQAFEIVGRSANGMTTALERKGIVVRKGTSDAQTFANVLSTLEERFGGSAQAQVQTFVSRLDQLKNGYENIQESIGQFVTKNPVVIEAMGMINDAFSKMADYIERNKEVILSFINNGLVNLSQGLATTLKVIDIFTRNMEGFRQVMWIALTAPVHLTTAALSGLGYAFTRLLGMIPGMKGGLKDLESDFKGLAKGGIQQVNDDAVDAFNQFTQKGALGHAADGVQDFTDKLRSFAATHKTLTNSMVKNTADAAKKQSEWEKKSAEERLAIVSGTLGMMAGMQVGHNKTLWNIAHGAAIAQATVDGILAVQKTLAAFPYPFSIPIAAAVGAVQAVNVAMIAAQTPGFAEGGIVGGNSYTGDKVVARVNSGEMFLTQNQQASLWNAIKSGNVGGGGGATVNLVNPILFDTQHVTKYILPLIKDSVRNYGGNFGYRGA